ncbi:MAG TPA: EF-P lysine aminoacylase EpmA [Acidiferrobacterales bacterium]|nr:EF-P lysine aminoacylase EpmA [Acidiferrobacterales bacterium]
MVDWQPVATLDVLRLRARILERLRAFFSERAVLEVETPVLSSAAATDPALSSFTTHYTGPLFPRGHTFYCHTSPEFPMKRLLAAGSGSIYQICRVFRNGEAGRFHNPEFTLLEWYRVGFDHRQLMDEAVALVTAILAGHRALATPERLTYREAFERHCGIDPHTADNRVLADAVTKHAIQTDLDIGHEDPDVLRDLLLTHVIEANLGRGRITVLYDYPASQAALARIRPEYPPVAERFELYLDGIELANGFHELTEAGEQLRRFEYDLQRRKSTSLPAVPPDARLLSALRAGLPECAGVALGIDRLAMLAAGVKSLREVLAFPADCA